MKFSKKQVVIGGAAALAIAVGGGAAYAYWTNGGSGNGSAKTDIASSFTVTVDHNITTLLSPGGPTATINYSITNNDSGSELVTSATPTVVDTTNAGCTAADFSITNNTFSSGQLAGGATGNYTFDLQMINASGNQDACKGVTVHLNVLAA